eukprot:8706452-Lingulodinium_polyedra.AAC.1
MASVRHPAMPGGDGPEPADDGAAGSPEDPEGTAEGDAAGDDDGPHPELGRQPDDSSSEESDPAHGDQSARAMPAGRARAGADLARHELDSAQ